jgi:hypothetical protein
LKLIFNFFRARKKLLAEARQKTLTDRENTNVKTEAFVSFARGMCSVSGSKRQRLEKSHSHTDKRRPMVARC